MTFRPTIILCLAIVLIGAAYDIWAVLHNYQWTISANLWYVARYTDWGPILCYLAGGLTFHVIFPNRAAKIDTSIDQKGTKP